MDQKTSREAGEAWEVESSMKSPILEMRKRLGMTQHQLALALGISRTSISDIENGLSALPGRVIRALAELHVKTDELVALQNEFVELTRSELRRQIAGKLS